MFCWFSKHLSCCHLQQHPLKWKTHTYTIKKPRHHGDVVRQEILTYVYTKDSILVLECYLLQELLGSLQYIWFVKFYWFFWFFWWSLLNDLFVFYNTLFYIIFILSSRSTASSYKLLLADELLLFADELLFIMSSDWFLL